MAAPWRRWRKRHESSETERAQAPEWPPAGPAAIYARALLERAEITEEYFVDQEISKNKWARQGKRPAGRIELAMPYDGHEGFTRAARADVAHATAGHPVPGSNAIIGHLLLKNYSRTDLGERLRLAERHDSITIEAPLDDGVPGDLDLLSADQRIGVTTYDFRPNPAAVIPAELEIDLFDPDSLSLPPMDLAALDPEADEFSDELRRHAENVATKIARQVSFKDELVLHIVVRLSVPAHAGHDPIKPKVARVAIGWPTITSLRALQLRVEDADRRDGRSFTKWPFRFNPTRKCIEWNGSEMSATAEMRGMGDGQPRESEKAEAPGKDSEPGKAEDPGKGPEPGEDSEPEKGSEPGEDAETGKDSAPGEDEEPKKSEQGPEPGGEREGDELGDGTMRQYESAPMLLSIRQPGDLYKEPIITVEAEVEVPGYLLSGMDARLHDAMGYYLKEPLTLTTKICAKAELRPDDTFARRDRSPSQDLFFGDIIPDERRITDITIALEDRGFTVKKVWPSHDGPHSDEATQTDSWLLWAHRKVGPDDMALWVLAVGSHSGTDRERIVHGGGVTHTTWLPSGELRIVIRGSLPGNSSRLTNEMNMLHRTLRERYGRARQQR